MTTRSKIERRRRRADYIEWRHSSVIIIRDSEMRPLFQLMLYGDAAHEITFCPGGGNLVAAALSRRGINPESVIFTLWDTATNKDRGGIL